MLEAEFEDGFILNQLERDDRSLFEKKRNTFYDIINKLCEKEHGKMIRFSIFVNGKRKDIDWKSVPTNSMPILNKDYEVVINNNGEVKDRQLVRINFGYEYFDKKQNKLIKRIETIQ